MIVASDRRRRLSAEKEVKDLQAGDCVRAVGGRRNGWVESVDFTAGTVTVLWDGSTIRDVLNFAMIRKVPPSWGGLDSRGKQ